MAEEIANNQQLTTNNHQPTTDESEDLKLELEKCQKEKEEYLNGWKRAKADFINFKNQMEGAQKELIRFANLGMILRFLPIYDGLKKACLSLNLEDPWAKGILNIKKQFDDFLKSLDIEEIKTVGEEFNPELHDAVAKEKREGVESDVVLEEVNGGYKMGGKVIMAAKVVVSE
jgi:molecular chaperone GrpE